MIAGKNDDAAKPKAKATTCATNPGGFNPAKPAATTATAIATRAAKSCGGCAFAELTVTS